MQWLSFIGESKRLTSRSRVLHGLDNYELEPGHAVWRGFDRLPAEEFGELWESVEKVLDHLFSAQVLSFVTRDVYFD